MLNNWIERIFGRNEGNNPNSRDRVKQRLQLILAHDRVALTPQMLDEMRREIMAVVSKYVEIDCDSMEISLETDQRATVMIANLPIRAIKECEEINLFEQSEQLEIANIDSVIDLEQSEIESQPEKTEEKESQTLEVSSQTSQRSLQ
jgi:cell division topological specificity factor